MYLPGAAENNPTGTGLVETWLTCTYLGRDKIRYPCDIIRMDGERIFFFFFFFSLSLFFFCAMEYCMGV